MGMVKEAATASEHSSSKLSDLSSSEASSSGIVATCSTPLELAIWQGASLLVNSMIAAGADPSGVWQAVSGFFYNLVTLEFEFSLTISIALLSLTFLTMIKHLFVYLWTTGPLTTAVSAVITLVVGPLPTIWRLLVLPPMRVFAFVRNELLPFVRRRALLTSSSFEVDLWFDTCQVRGLAPDGEGCADGEPDADAEAEADGEAAAAAAATDAAPPPKNGNGTPAGAVSESAPPPSPSAAQTEAKPGPASPSGLPPTAPNTREGLPRGQGAKQRFHKLSKHQMAEARSAAARGEAAAGAPPGAAGQPHAAQPIPPELILAPPLALSTPLSVILARRPHPMARANAARALQFDLLLSSTKYRRRALLAKRFGELDLWLGTSDPSRA